jgi:hypothetical protein
LKISWYGSERKHQNFSIKKCHAQCCGSQTFCYGTGSDFSLCFGFGSYATCNNFRGSHVLILPKMFLHGFLNHTFQRNCIFPHNYQNCLFILDVFVKIKVPVQNFPFRIQITVSYSLSTLAGDVVVVGRFFARSVPVALFCSSVPGL